MPYKQVPKALTRYTIFLDRPGRRKIRKVMKALRQPSYSSTWRAILDEKFEALFPESEAKR